MASLSLFNPTFCTFLGWTNKTFNKEEYVDKKTEKHKMRKVYSDLVQFFRYVNEAGLEALHGRLRLLQRFAGQHLRWHSGKNEKTNYYLTNLKRAKTSEKGKNL
jgi:hypothetical protein